jgi:hypothetical protein
VGSSTFFFLGFAHFIKQNGISVFVLVEKCQLIVFIPLDLPQESGVFVDVRLADFYFAADGIQ